MFKKVIERWRLFWTLEAGHRFQTRYHNHRRRRDQGETSKWVSLLNLLSGPALIVAGIAFIPTPGPSYIIIVIGMWMLAGEFLPLARFFDRVDVRLRELGRWIRSVWIKSSAVVRALITMTILLCIAALGYWLIT